jgi:hypothetical protein
VTITTRDLTHGWDIDSEQPVTRTFCLALHWADDDPMPSRCSLRHGHDSDHRVSAAMGITTTKGPLLTWPNEEDDQ